MTIPAAAWRGMTLGGYFALFALLIVWYGWLSPSSGLPTFFVLLVLGTPLLLPLRGLLHGRRYTYQWSLFLALAYLTHGIVEAYGTPDDRFYAGLEILFALTWLIAAIGYVRSLGARKATSTGV